MKKARTTQHILENVSQAIFRGLLPQPWVIHEYKPDYGLDYAVEVFDEIPSVSRGHFQLYETLGEMFFVQLKAIRHVNFKASRSTISNQARWRLT